MGLFSLLDTRRFYGHIALIAEEAWLVFLLLSILGHLLPHIVWDLIWHKEEIAWFGWLEWWVVEERGWKVEGEEGDGDGIFIEYSIFL